MPESTNESQVSNQHEIHGKQSPPWQDSTKRIAVTLLVILTLLSLYLVRSVIIPIMMSFVLAYLLLPAVEVIQKRFRIRHSFAVSVVYLLLVALIIAIPITTIPQLITQGNDLIANIPDYLTAIGSDLGEPIKIAGFTIHLEDLPLENVYQSLSDNLVTIAQTIAPQGLRLFGATLSTVAWILIVLVLSFYMVKDHQILWNSLVSLAPVDYHDDLKQLGLETSGIWNAFLRGQLILGLIIGVATLILATILGLPNALFLALLAGILEFIPNIGPIIATIPALFLALFQSDASWLGQLVGPLWFGVIVVLVYGLVQRVENVYLVPRIIGRSLNLHPLFVLIAALIGASVAGVFGILLAAPLLASGKLILLYIYRKLLDQPPFDEPV